MSLINFLEAFCAEYDYKLVLDYSGRGMYGATCIGITCNNTLTMVQRLMQYAMQCNYPLNLPEPCSDNMGLGYIVYWPMLHC